MRFILNNIKLALNFLFIILLALVFSCSEKEVKPFVGKKIDIHLSSQSMASRDFAINIDEVTQNNYWFKREEMTLIQFQILNLNCLLIKYFLKILIKKYQMNILS